MKCCWKVMNFVGFDLFCQSYCFRSLFHHPKQHRSDSIRRIRFTLKHLRAVVVVRWSVDLKNFLSLATCVRRFSEDGVGGEAVRKRKRRQSKLRLLKNPPIPFVSLWNVSLDGGEQEKCFHDWTVSSVYAAVRGGEISISSRRCGLVSTPRMLLIAHSRITSHVHAVTLGLRCSSCKCGYLRRSVRVIWQ